MIHATTDQVQAALDFPPLIAQLRKAFQADYEVPMRHHHDFKNPIASKDSTLLLMPAWQAGAHLGVKIVTISPENGQYQLPAIYGIYLMFDAQKGMPLLQADARLLTTKRTAAASALASSYLSRVDSQSLLMVGTGAMAPQLIEAHSAIRPIKNVWVWGRSIEKAEKTIAELAHLSNIQFKVATDLGTIVPQVDIISCATLSPDPIIKGSWLRPGQHVDLVGSYKPDMREADDKVILRSKVYVDTFEGATKETGDILIPLQTQVLQREEILGDLFSLCQGKSQGRRQDDSITLFKSVGHALEDLAAAQLLYKHLVSN